MGTLYGLLQDRARQQPNTAWLWFGSHSYNYAQCLVAADRLAEQLLASEIVAGDRIAIYMTKTPAAVVAMLACSRLGAVYVPVNPLFKVEQLQHVLQDCNVKALFVAQDREAYVQAAIQPSTQSAFVCKLIISDQPAAIDTYRVTPIAGAASAAELPARFASAELILYTSGSTGRPKGVVLSRDNLLLGANSVASYLGLSPDDKLLALLPFAFDYGLNQLTSALASSAGLVLLDFLLVNDVVKAVAKHGVTGIAGVPPLWFKLADAKWRDGAGESLRFFTNSGGHMGGPLLQRLKLVFPNATPYLMYGFTEAFRSTYLDPAQLPERSGSIGKAIPSAEVFVINDKGEHAAANERGEIVHCGPLVTLGYWNAEGQNAPRFRPAPSFATLRSSTGDAAWSGDTGYADEEGYLYFVGRADEMIKSSGYRISPEEVEEIAYTIKGVGEAVATGVADPILGQAIVLVVTQNTGCDFTELDIMNHYRKVAPEYMVPARVLIWEQLPRTASAKFDRVAIKAKVSG